jgi:hypothetical protein
LTLDRESGDFSVAARVTVGKVTQESTVTFRVHRLPALAIQGPSGKITKGGSAEFTITVRNPASLTLPNVAFQVILPDALLYKGQRFGGKALTWKMTDIAPGGQSSQAVQLTTTEAGTHTVTVNLLLNGGLARTGTATVEVEIPPRFQVSSSGVISDSETGLEWYVGPDKDTTWDEADAWVKGLTVDGGGWRLPSVEELKGLYQQGKGIRNMDTVFVTSGWYVWSYETKGSSARDFYFLDGAEYWLGRSSSADPRVFAVRSRR